MIYIRKIWDIYKRDIFSLFQICCPLLNITNKTIFKNFTCDDSKNEQSSFLCKYFYTKLN